MIRPIFKALREPPWRTVVLGVFVLGLFFGSYAVWRPGLDVRDGRHDRGRNGIWIGHGWFAADEWFIRDGRTNEISRFRDPARIRDLASLLRSHHITEVFPHLCPSDSDGHLPPVDDAQIERFLSEFENFRVIPWTGGPQGPTTRFRDPKWRAEFITSITNLLSAHPRLAGVQINVEPLESGDKDFLNFLKQIHSALPKDKLLSIAAYPPPTRWQPFPDVHWDEKYFHEVAKRSDQLAVMMYDTSIRFPKIYEAVMARWTAEVVSWSEGKPVLLGIPTYDDQGVDYHKPNVENIRTALLGIHRGLAAVPLATNYQGVAIYCEWETDVTEWSYFDSHFVKR